MSYKERAIKGISWNFLLLILAAPIGYLVRMLYANEIPKLEVGLFLLFWTFAVWLLFLRIWV